MFTKYSNENKPRYFDNLVISKDFVERKAYLDWVTNCFVTTDERGYWQYLQPDDYYWRRFQE